MAGAEHDRDADSPGRRRSEEDDWDWSTDDAFWLSNYETRDYASADVPYEAFRPAYRYGFESAHRLVGRDWHEVESELRAGWSDLDLRGATRRPAWEEVRSAVKEAWDRVRHRSDRL